MTVPCQLSCKFEASNHIKVLAVTSSSLAAPFPPECWAWKNEYPNTIEGQENWPVCLVLICTLGTKSLLSIFAGFFDSNFQLQMMFGHNFIRNAKQIQIYTLPQRILHDSLVIAENSLYLRKNQIKQLRTSAQPALHNSSRIAQSISVPVDFHWNWSKNFKSFQIKQNNLRVQTLHIPCSTSSSRNTAYQRWNVSFFGLATIFNS